MLWGRGVFIGATAMLAVPVAVVTASTDPVDVDVDALPAPAVIERIPPGHYTGEATWAFDGLVFSIDGDTLVLHGGSRGPVDLMVDNEELVRGRFTFGGEWTMDVTIDGMTGTLEATTTTTGTLVGESGEVVATGEETTDGRMTFLGHTSSYSHVEPLPRAVMQVNAASCSELSGTWERAWQVAAGDIGYDNPEKLTGTFWAIRTSTEDDRQRVDDFFDQPFDPDAFDTSGELPLLVVEYAQFIADLDAFARAAFETETPILPEEFRDLLERAERLSIEARNADPCGLADESAQRIATAATRSVQEILAQLWVFGDAGWSSGDVRWLANKALEHGAAGPLAQNADAAAFAEAFFRDWVIDTLNENLIDGGIATNDDTVNALMIGTAFDMSDLPVGGGTLHPDRTMTLSGDLITWVTE